MSITDELREWFKDRFFMANGWQEIHDIADRIDAEHKKACDDAWDNGYGADYLGIEKWLTEHPQEMEYHGWIRLPVDADNVPVSIGDRMEWVRYKDDDPTIVRTVSGIGNGVFFAWSDEQGRYAQYEANAYRHYHAPTVDDVLREFAGTLASADNNWGSDVNDAIAKYAAKLSLAKGEDA